MQVVEIVMLAALPLLLVLSGFFSGSETALFSMSETERMQLRRRGTLAGRAVQSLLADPRSLLITVLLGNMIVNVLYFVLSSMLMMRLHVGVIGGLGLAVGSLLAIVLFGEVLPKMLANARRLTFASMVSPVLLTLHNIIAPLRVVIQHLVVVPLGRLTAPTAAPQQLDEQELQALLEISSQQGVIDVEEQRILRDVLALSRLRVRDIMTPRVRIAAVGLSETREQVLEIVRQTRRARLPVYAGDLDHIAGVLPVRDFLLDPRSGKLPLRQSMIRAQFVPSIARLDQLLDHFRKTRSGFAIVVDEFGGTAGVVALEDLVERIVGELAPQDEQELVPARMIALNTWLVDGNMSVHDWAEAFGQRLISPRVSTVGGLIIDRLGRVPEVDDQVTVGNVQLQVDEVAGARVTLATVKLLSGTVPPPTSQEASP